MDGKKRVYLFGVKCGEINFLSLVSAVFLALLCSCSVMFSGVPA